jgi:hypothetical protein
MRFKRGRPRSLKGRFLRPEEEKGEGGEGGEFRHTCL